MNQRREVAQNQHVEAQSRPQQPDRATMARGRNAVTDADVNRALSRLDRAFDADLAAFARSARQPASDDGILYIGFNTESEKKEIEALGKTGLVRALVETSGEDDVIIQGTRYRLSAPRTASAAAVAPILRGLRELDRNIIPETDCHH